MIREFREVLRGTEDDVRIKKQVDALFDRTVRIKRRTINPISPTKFPV